MLLKVTVVALVKSGYMLGNLSDVTLLRSELQWPRKNQIEVRMRWLQTISRKD